MANKIIRLPGKITTDQIEGYDGGGTEGVSVTYSGSSYPQDTNIVIGSTTYPLITNTTPNDIAHATVAPTWNAMNNALNGKQGEILYLFDYESSSGGSLSGAYNNVAQAVSEGKQVIFKIQMDDYGNDSIVYCSNIGDRVEEDSSYWFVGLFGSYLYDVMLYDDDTIYIHHREIQSKLVSGTNIKTINNESLLGSGNITISGGSGGEANVIEVVKVNGTALTPDANKTVNIPLATGSSDGLMSLQDKSILSSVKVVSITQVPSGSSSDLGTTITIDSTGYKLISAIAPAAASEYLIAPSWGALKQYASISNGTITINGTSITPPTSALTSITTSGNGNAVTGVNTSDGVVTLRKDATYITASALGSYAPLASPNFSGTPKISNVNIATVNDIPTIPNITKGTTTGSGNVVSDISVSGHTITLTKGVTALTEVPLGTNSVVGGAMLANGNVGTVSSSTYAQGFGTTENHLCLASATTSAAGAMSASDKVKVDKLPNVTASDVGKVLTINSSGNIVATTPSYIYSGSASPSSSTGNNGDIYIQS